MKKDEEGGCFGEDKVITVMGEKFYRSDLAAEMLRMHKNTLLQKARQGKIKKFRHNRAVWFTKPWMMAYIARESV